MATLNERIPNGFRGTARTITRMNQLVALAVSGVGPDGKQDDRIVALAREITFSCPMKDYEAEAAAILAWMQANVRYVQDQYLPTGIERVQHPCVTIFDLRSGDCDCLATAYSALCAAIGHPWGFRTVGVNPLDPGEFAHVYSLVNVAGRWVPADPSFATAPLGWEPPPDTDRWNLAPRTGVVAVYRRDWSSDA